MSDKSVFCPAPFVSQVLWADGKIGVCCNDRGMVVENAIVEFNHVRREKLKESFRNNVIPEICKGCYNKYLLTKSSLVTVYKDIYGEFYNKSLEVEKPKYMHFSASNKCNLACKTCNEVASDMYGRTYKGMAISDSLNKNDMDFYLKYLNDNIDNLGYFTFHGGEPMRDDSFPDIVKILKKNENIHITLITNGTSLLCKAGSVIDMFRTFKKLRIMMSLDSINWVNNYIRSFSDTKKIIQNFNTYALELPQATMTFHTVICNLSLLYLHDLLSMFVDGKTINRLNEWSYYILEWPEIYQIENLPDRYKERITNNLFNESMVDKIKDSIIKPTYDSLKIELFNRWENSTEDLKYWKDFLKQSREMDEKSLIATDKLTNILLNV